MGFRALCVSDFEIKGYDEQINIIKGMMTDDPAFRQRLRRAIAKVFLQVKKDVQRDAKSMLGSDPRHAYKAVKYTVYKRILGAQVNILQRRRRGAPTNYRAQQKGVSGRGGNRWTRGNETDRMDSYEGTDRGFILRFFNAGAMAGGGNRNIVSYSDKQGSSHSISGQGNRGHIAGNNWFESSSEKAVRRALVELQILIEDVINGNFV